MATPADTHVTNPPATSQPPTRSTPQSTSESKPKRKTAQRKTAQRKTAQQSPPADPRQSFAHIWARAAARKGGEAELMALVDVRYEVPLHAPVPLSTLPDDRALAEMTRAVFQAGFVWRVIDQKWPGFEAAFMGFSPEMWAKATAIDMGVLMDDARIVRNGQKIDTVAVNARMIQALSAEHGSFGAWLEAWPDTDIVGLLGVLSKRGSRLGSMTGQRVLRRLGKPCFILTPSVLAALCLAGVLEAPKATAKRDLAKVQHAFNVWAAESGRDFNTISRVLALSVDA